MGCILLGGSLSAQAPQKYWVQLATKPADSPALISAQTRQQRQQMGLSPEHLTDRALDADRVAAIAARATAMGGQSRWLNAVVAYLTPPQRVRVAQLPGVVAIWPVGRAPHVAQRDDIPPEAESWAEPALPQMQSPALAAARLTGQGVAIGVIDAGFYQAHQHLALRHLFAEGRIRGYRDFVSPTRADFFGTAETPLDGHGTTVLKMIAGMSDQGQHGMATGATFYLARTDHGSYEFRGEEDYWIAALEWMDSLGVRLVNTSLGYALGFDDPHENYQPTQMDGSSAIARAAQIATEEKGILVVVSAGNDGMNKAWRYISTPADAPGVLSVGATFAQPWHRVPYSGIGPEYLPYLKPNVSCFSLTGTSFAAPVVAGLAACLLEKNPQLRGDQLHSLIEQSGHLYPFGNNHVGYGVPQADRALWLLDSTAAPASPSPQTARRVVRLRRETATVVVYHKSDAHQVVAQQVIRPVRGRLVIRRHRQAARTTLDSPTGVREFIWAD